MSARTTSRLAQAWALMRHPIAESRRRHAAGGFHPLFRLALFVTGVALIVISNWGWR